MKIIRCIPIPSILLVFSILYFGNGHHDVNAQQDRPSIAVGDTIALPQPRMESNTSIEEAVANRRSRRNISDAVVELSKLSQLLWAAQGITDRKNNFRAAPSAGAKYPLEIFVFVGNVEQIPAGLYRYIPEGHKLVTISDRDERRALGRSIYHTDRILTPPMTFVISAVYERTELKYGTQRGPRYVHIEAGACAENIALQAESLYLATFVMGAFDDHFAYKACRMDKEKPLIIMPIGYEKKT